MLCPHGPAFGAECSGHIPLGLVGKPQTSKKGRKKEEGCDRWLIVYIVPRGPTGFGTKRTLHIFYQIHPCQCMYVHVCVYTHASNKFVFHGYTNEDFETTALVSVSP